MRHAVLIAACAAWALTAIPAMAAESTAPMTPEMASKREMVQRQQDQRITNDKRKAAAEALKAERARVYKAHQEISGSETAPAQK